MNAVQLPAQVTLDALSINDFEQWLDASGIAGSSKRAYVSRMRNFAAFLSATDSDCQFESFEACVFSYIMQLRKAERTNSSVRGFLVALKSYCRFKELPEPQLKVSSAPNPVKVLPGRQQQQLLELLDEHASNRDRALVALVLLSGLRTGECVRINLTDLSYQAGVLQLIVRNEQGLIDRSIPLSSVAKRFVGAWIIERRAMEPKCDALFVSAHGARLHPNSVRWLVRHFGELLGVDLSPQVLRSSFIANLVGKVDDFELIGSLVGIRSSSRIANFLCKRHTVDKLAAVELACTEPLLQAQTG